MNKEMSNEKNLVTIGYVWAEDFDDLESQYEAGSQETSLAEHFATYLSRLDYGQENDDEVLYGGVTLRSISEISSPQFSTVEKVNVSGISYFVVIDKHHRMAALYRALL